MGRVEEAGPQTSSEAGLLLSCKSSLIGAMCNRNGRWRGDRPAGQTVRRVAQRLLEQRIA
jgi:hypothetical protein